jgi:hypothetical protein
MALLKPLMLMGGSLSDQARGARREAARSTQVGNKFSSLMEAQMLPASPQAAMQFVRTRTLAGLSRIKDGAGAEPARDAMTEQSMRAMANALSQNLSRPAAKSSNDAARLGKARDVLPATGKAAQNARAYLRQSADANRLGSLSARFESGAEGIAAIGYDRMGGTSYGKYQIASKPGSMKDFLQFLDKEAPDVSAKLRAAGPANTGGRKGRMPTVWRDIAAQEPERFADLQERFIRDTHYKPALESVRRAGFNTDEFSPALQEVLWSTAVQHGPAGAARIFIRAAEQANTARPKDTELIRSVYAKRAGQFTSSTETVRTAVQQRLRQEQHLALAMVEGRRPESRMTAG